MARTFIQPGDVCTFTAPTGGVTSGTPVLIGNLLVIPTTSAAVGAAFEGMAVGIHQVAKASGQTWAEGALVYWDNTAKNFTTTSTNNYRVGCAAAAAASGDTTGKVRLTGAPAPTGA